MKKKKWKCGFVMGVVLAIILNSFSMKMTKAADTHELNTMMKDEDSDGKYIYGKYTYNIIRNGTAISIKRYIGEESKIATPAHIKGLPVKEIGKGAFVLNKNIREVVITEGIEKINHSAFAYCYNLKKITIAKSVKRISNYAFWDCRKLSIIKGGKGVRRIGKGVFWCCKKITKIPDFPKVKYWFGSNFSGTGIKNITVPEGVQVCANSQFYDCKKLKRVVIKKADDLWPRMFYESSVREVIIKKGAKMIRREAFGNCKKLKKVVIPKTTKKIGLRAFQNCKSLRKLTIPKSVKKIDVTAFDGCSKKLKLYVYSKSYALKYAKRNHITYKVIKR